MTDITPPPELVQQWLSEFLNEVPIGQLHAYIATRAAQWGADQELDACCEWLGTQLLDGDDLEPIANDLRTARRPKPPSLKDQAMALLDKIQGNREAWIVDELDVVRKALEALPDD